MIHVEGRVLIRGLGGCKGHLPLRHRGEALLPALSVERGVEVVRHGCGGLAQVVWLVWGIIELASSPSPSL